MRDKLGGSVLYAWRALRRAWHRVRADRLLTAIVAPLAVLLLTAVAGGAISLSASLRGDSVPDVIKEIRDQDVWIDRPTLFPEAAGMLDEPIRALVPRSKFDPYPQVRTAQELADDAPSLAGQPVIVVGRVAAVEAREDGHSELGQSEIALLDDDAESRVVLVGGISIGRIPPPLVPEKPGRFIPLPGSMQRFKPEFRYGVFLARVAAVGDTVSPDGGRVRTTYILASEHILMSTADAPPQLGVAVQEALDDLSRRQGGAT